MAPTNTPVSGDSLGPPKKAAVLTVLHRALCVLCVLITLVYLLRCYCAFACAIDDLRVHKGLGFSYSFMHFLKENSFVETLRMFLLVLVEFLVYTILCKRVERKKSFVGGIVYFSIMLVLHTVVWLHARSLDFPKTPPYITDDGVRFDYYIYAVTTIWLSVVYLVMYLFRVRKHQSKGDVDLSK